MMKTKLMTVVVAVAGVCARADEPKNLPMAAGPFKGTAESLATYQYPDWFRDAKFGIWAHWGPQAVPMEGDWYARQMYQEGSKDYKYHVEHYGHPSVFGYKDIIPLWKAEKWDPEKLMALYKKAGARYFVSMGTHHDNFFLWKSKLHKWNSVNMGPKRDVVGEWQKAAKNQGLPFGVSEHLGASFWWFQTSHGADKTGPKAGVPYDGANPEFQDLYHFPADPADKSTWYSANPKWQQQWYDEIKELVDNYKPDLLYSDGGVAFGSNHEVGLSMIAHLYNTTPTAVYNCKQKSGGRWVEDLERGIMPRIEPNPWQTDTSIGDWFYNRHWKYQSVTWVIDMLVDNVSKNGNLLLNVVLRPDGSLDPEAEQMLEQLASWIAIHGEGIYGTRPWLVYGESAIKVKGGSFKEDFKYTAKEIRFTTKGPTLYAFALGWPDDRKIVIRSLAKPVGADVNNITSISLLGHDGKLSWQQTAEGLTVVLPATKVSEFTAALKITATNLKNIPFEAPGKPAVQADAHGKLTLTPSDADLDNSIIVETLNGQPNLGSWNNSDDTASWEVQVGAVGKYHVRTATAALAAGDFIIQVGDQALDGHAPKTNGWNEFTDVDLGTVVINAAGKTTVTARAKDAGNWKPINLRAITLSPE